MKTTTLYYLLATLILSFIFYSSSTEAIQHPDSSKTHCFVPFYPDTLEIEQIDGSTFKATYVKADGILYIETLDGYTVLQDEQDQSFKYASRGTKGDLFLSGALVTDIAQRPTAVQTLLHHKQRHLRYEDQTLVSLISEAAEKNINDPNGGIDAVFPASGVRKSLLLLIDFPDQAFTYPTADFDNLANQSGYSVNGATGSFKEYYEDISYGILTINTDVEGWYTAANNRATYGAQNINSPNATHAIPLVREAVDAAEAAGVDFSQYDGDGDGRVDVIEIIHSGRGAEESGNAADIWSHRWGLAATGQQVTYDGKLINDYIIQAEKYGPTNITNIGVLVHEFGHALGLPDLYDTDYSSRGLGRWCCMAGGTWNNSGRTPAQFSAWCKKQLGWMAPSVLTGSGSISNMDYSMNNPDAYQFNTTVNNEYFLIENRRKTGWDQYIPAAGLCIYHIDDNQFSNSNENHYKVHLEQADGDADLNNNVNQGDGGDPFPGNSNNTVFDCNSSPNSGIYNGSASNISISNIGISNHLASFNYDYCSTDCNISDIAVAAGPLNLSGNTYDMELSVYFNFPPASGTLDLLVNGSLYQFTIATSPQVVTLANLIADGNPVDINASFSADASCSYSENAVFTAPFNCNNDDVCDALDITAYINNGVVSCNNIGATAQTNEPKPSYSGNCYTQNSWCDNSVTRSVWYKFTAPASASINIDFNSAVDMQMALWEADNCSDILDPSKVLLVAANDDSGSAGGYSPKLDNVTCLVAGKTYYLQIDGYNGTANYYNFMITDPQLACNSAATAGAGCGNSFTANSIAAGEWIHLYNGNGQIIASVNDKFNNLGQISTSFNINNGATRVDDNNYPLLDRDWSIQVSNNAAACVRLYLTDAELQALISAQGVSQLSDLHLSKISGANCNELNGSEVFITQKTSMMNFSPNTHMLEFEVSGFSNFFPRGNASILPVDLLRFTGQAEEKYNQLEWATASEYNTDYFEIERFDEQKQTWQALDQISAVGFSEQEQSYSYKDFSVLADAYYRLKIVDYNHSVEYSDIIQVNRAATDFRLVNTYPNPVRELLYVEFLATQADELVELSLLNAAAQQVAHYTYRSEAGLNYKKLDVGKLQSGVYMLRIQSGQVLAFEKIVVN